MKKVRLLAVVQGVGDAGDVVEVPAGYAAALIVAGAAEPVEDE